MTKQSNNTPAFPVSGNTTSQFGEYSHLEEGMSKRFWAATKILQGLVQIPIEGVGSIQSDVEAAYNYADELLKQEFKNE